MLCYVQCQIDKPLSATRYISLFKKLQVYDAFINIYRNIYIYNVSPYICIYVYKYHKQWISLKLNRNPMNEWLNEWMNEFNWIHIEKSLWYERNVERKKNTHTHTYTKENINTITNTPCLIRMSVCMCVCTLCANQIKSIAGILYVKNAMHFIYIYTFSILNEFIHIQFHSISFSISVFYAFWYAYNIINVI